MIITSGGPFYGKGTKMNYSLTRFELHPVSMLEPRLDQNWIWSGVLPATGFAIAYAPPASGKTFLMVHLGLSVASGTPLAGRKTAKTGVIYCAAEAGDGIDNRILMAKKGMGLPDNIPFLVLKVPPNLGKNDEDVDELIRAIKDAEQKLNVKFGLVIIDTMARVIPGLDENSSKDAGQFIANAEKIVRELNALVIAVHHTGKNTEGGLRGSSAFDGAADTILSIRDKGDYHWVQIEKQREGAANLGFSFKLKQVEVGLDSQGEKITTCVVDDVSILQPSDEESLKRKMIQKESKYLKSINEALDDCLMTDGTDVVLNDGSRVKAVPQSTLMATFCGQYPKVKPETIKKAFIRTLRTSQERGDIGIVTYGGSDMIYKLK